MMKNGMTLYHGSYIEVTNPDLSRCRDGKDFGRGFYLTSDKNQAKRFVSQSLTRAKQRGDVPYNRRRHHDLFGRRLRRCGLRTCGSDGHSVVGTGQTEGSVLFPYRKVFRNAHIRKK